VLICCFIVALPPNGHDPYILFFLSDLLFTRLVVCPFLTCRSDVLHDPNARLILG
jgi:hypothetical protein